MKTNMRYTVEVDYVDTNNYMERWYKENTKILHHENGPSYILVSPGGYKVEKWITDGKLDSNIRPSQIEYVNGKITETWYKNNMFHNNNGPAIIVRDTNGNIIKREWCIDGSYLTEEEFNNRKNTCDGKVVEINGKKYKLTAI